MPDVTMPHFNRIVGSPSNTHVRLMSPSLIADFAGRDVNNRY
ncbi:MAG TPA: hypothetical protein VFF31_29600 [Blastocatellia bacterium]|nr:hypothetical protein [Blastocatellia bacterium]